MNESEEQNDQSELQDEVQVQKSEKKSTKNDLNLLKESNSRDSRLVYLPQADGSVTQIDFETIMKMKLKKQQVVVEVEKQKVIKVPTPKIKSPEPEPEIKEEDVKVVKEIKQVEVKEPYEKLWGYNKVNLLNKMKILHQELFYQKQQYLKNQQQEFLQNQNQKFQEFLNKKRIENNKIIIQREPIKPARSNQLFDRENKFLHQESPLLRQGDQVQSEKNIHKLKVIPWKPGRAILQGFDTIYKNRSSSLNSSCQANKQHQLDYNFNPNLLSCNAHKSKSLENQIRQKNNQIQSQKSQKTFITATKKNRVFPKTRILTNYTKYLGISFLIPSQELGHCILETWIIFEWKNL